MNRYDLIKLAVQNSELLQKEVRNIATKETLSKKDIKVMAITALDAYNCTKKL